MNRRRRGPTPSKEIARIGMRSPPFRPRRATPWDAPRCRHFGSEVPAYAPPVTGGLAGSNSRDAGPDAPGGCFAFTARTIVSNETVV